MSGPTANDPIADMSLCPVSELSIGLRDWVGNEIDFEGR